METELKKRFRKESFFVKRHTLAFGFSKFDSVLKSKIMNQKLLEAKENILKEQLHIVQLEKEKYACIVSQDYESATKIKKQIDKARINLEDVTIPYCRLIIEDNSKEWEWKDLLFLLAPSESKFQNIILETELRNQGKMLREEQAFEIRQPIINEEKLKRKNQLSRMFAHMTSLLEQWTEYYDCQKNILSPQVYTNLINIKYRALEVFPELQAVHSFSGSYIEIVSQLRTHFLKKNPMFNPILFISVQYGTNDDKAIPEEEQLFLANLFDEIFEESTIIFCEKIKNLRDSDKLTLILTIEQNYFSPSIG